jgi:DNA-binding SARP family transcriptional activator
MADDLEGVAITARLDLLRRPRLLSGGSEHVLSRKDAALLAIVALDGSAARDVIAAMLWPDAPGERARSNLRQRRFRLGRSAGAPLLAGDERLTLTTHVLHPARDLDGALAIDPDACEGEWLEGLSYGDCPEMDRWLLLARERWRVLRSQALARVASAHERGERVELALRLATRLAAHEPLSDHAHRRLMRLHHLRGDLGAALDVYRRFAERLDAELGELPDDETAALAASLRRGEAALRVSAPVPPTLARPVRRIGRDEAWSMLQHAAQQRAPLLIEGAPGVGKTRMLSDFVAAADDSRAVLVPALAGDAGRPYAVLSRLLSRLWFDRDALRPDDVSALPGWARRELAALLPELGEAPARADALRLQRALALALQNAALDAVALDDLQQADPASLELLPALNGEGLPAWLLAVRAGEVPEAIQRWLQGSNAPQQLRLVPLTAQQLVELLDDLALPGVGGDEWARALMRHTGGLPLFVLETLRGLYQQGRPALDALPSSTGAAQAVRARAAGLADAARQLAHVAAVLRTPLALADSAALLGGQAVDWRAAFAELEAAQWLDGDGRMHDVVAAALREAMPAAERRWLHGCIGALLRERDSASLEAAQHFEAAGRDADAAPLFEAAAENARRASRPAEHAALLDRAVRCWTRASQPERAFAAQNVRVAPLIWTAGCAQALALVREMLANAVTPAQRAAALSELGHVLGADGDHAGAIAPAREALALALAQPECSADDRLKCVQILVNHLPYVGAADEALALVTQYLPLAEAEGGLRYQLFLNAQSQVLHRMSRLKECAAVIRRSLELMVAEQNWREVVTVSGNLSIVLGDLGRYEEAWREIELAGQALSRLGGIEATPSGSYHLKSGHVLLGLGRLGSAIAAYSQARALYAAHNDSDAWLVGCDHGVAHAHLLRGDAAAAAACLQPFKTPQAVFMQVRRALLQAKIAFALGGDVASPMAQARAAMAGSSDRAAQLMIDADALALEDTGRDPARLLAVETGLRAIEQDASALRLAWWRVDALRGAGDAAAAAALARELLAQPAWPSQLLPCHWLAIAQAALAAVGDAHTPVLTARAEQAWHDTLADLADLPGPSQQWPGPASVTAR